MTRNLSRGQRLFIAPPAFLLSGLVLCALALAVAAWSCQSAPSAQRGPTAPAEAQVPAELRALMQRAAAAANGRDPAAMEPFAAGGAAQLFAWTRSKTSQWRGGVLPLPTAGKTESPAYLGVFHDWHTCESDGDHVHRLVKTPEGWKLDREILETDTLGFLIRDHDLRVTLDVPQRAASISDTIRMERADSPPQDFALLRLSSDFTVSELRRDGPEGAAIPFRQVGGVIAFVPPAEKTFALHLRYRGTVRHDISDYILEREATLNSYWYPHIARLPATATVTATVPAGWTAIAPGERIGERRANGSATFTYRNAAPISFYTLGAGRFTITSRTVGGRSLSAYLLAPNAALANRSLDLLERALAYFETHFGPFPYTRYTLVESQGPFAGALEAYSFATFGPQMLPAAIPHEVAHTWWGGLVSCTYTRSMWNESLCEYSDSLFQRARAPQAAGIPRGRRAFTSAYDFAPMTQAHDTSDEAHASVGYDKGRQVMRVLEQEVGQPALLRCLAALARRHARKAPIEWPQIEAVAQEVTGRSLRWFFAQWMERAGLPILRLAHIRAERAASGGDFVVSGEIVQEGTPYRLSVPILLETRDGAGVRATITVQNARAPLRLRVRSAPARLTLDPEQILPLAFPEGQPRSSDPTVYEFPRATASRPASRSSQSGRTSPTV